ncbi:MAG: cupin domain-containing protein [Actinomycetota bacterium]|nr:cupin domain-containing protein [Actinomycetota bacterium]
MSITKRILVVFAVLSGLLGAHVALATPPSGTIARTELAKGTTTEPIFINTQGAETSFYIQTVTLDPGADSGWHTHPGPEYTIVKSGTITVQTASNCPPFTRSAGEIFFVKGGVSHRAVNLSDAPAELYVTYTLPASAPIREDQPDACQAP